MISRTFSQAYSTGSNVQRMMEARQGGLTFPLPILGIFTGKDRDVLRVPAGLDLWRRGPGSAPTQWPKWLERFITKSFKLTVPAQFELLDPESESMSPTEQEAVKALRASAAGALLMTIQDREAADGSVRPFQLVTSSTFTYRHDSVQHEKINLPPMDWLALVPITRPGSDVVQWQVSVPISDADRANPDREFNRPLEVATCEVASKLLRGLSGVATRSQLPTPAAR